MAKYSYRPVGVCSQGIEVDIDGDIINDVEFTGGCDGNLKAIAKLVKGRSIDEVVAVIEGNTCGPRNTSCADQLARALIEAKGNEM